MEHGAGVHLSDRQEPDGVREPREAELHDGHGPRAREAHVQAVLDTAPGCL